MKLVIKALVILAISVFSALPASSAQIYEIDPLHSSACFNVGHLGIGIVHGCFTDLSGQVVYDAKTPSKSSVSITIKTASVNTFVEKRDEHLRTADFFDVEKYPVMEFKSVKVKNLGKNRIEITGDFTLHGITKRIKVKASKLGEGKDSWGGYRAAFQSDFTIKRSDYGMKTMIPAAGDRVKISLLFEGTLKK